MSGTTYILTHGGKKLLLNDLQSEQIELRDIAHALSLTCRFGGQCKHFYSVAQHSILVARIATTYAAQEPGCFPIGDTYLAALMHDAAEAYMGDIITPIKVHLGQKCEWLETALNIVIARHFDLPQVSKSIIKLADMTALATEVRDLLPLDEELLASLPKPLPDKIIPVGARQAERDFINHYKWAIKQQLTDNRAQAHNLSQGG